MTKDLRLNARINADFQRKLRELSDTLGINQSAVLTVAINRLHQQEIKTMTRNTDNEPVTDMQTYATRTQAKAAIANMQGWDAKPVKYCFATVGGGTVDAWVIECDGDKYLREDGFVR